MSFADRSAWSTASSTAVWKPRLVDDEVGVLHGTDLLGLQLDVVRLDAGGGEVVDVDVGATDLLGDEGERVERRHHPRAAGLRVRAARGKGAGEQHPEQDDGCLHENDSQLDENHCQFWFDRAAVAAWTFGVDRLAPPRARAATAARTGPPTTSRNGTSAWPPKTKTVDTVISLAKRRGFVYQCGEIYGGTKSAWDYGPLGVELKDNIKRQWWRSMVQSRDDIVGLDSSVILPTPVWEASGHLAAFVDPLVECQNCHQRFRQDHLQEEYAEKQGPRRSRCRRDVAHRLPALRHQGRVDRAADVQRPAQDVPRPGRERGGPALPAPRDRPGHLRELHPGA